MRLSAQEKWLFLLLAGIALAAGGAWWAIQRDTDSRAVEQRERAAQDAEAAKTEARLRAALLDAGP